MTVIEDVNQKIGQHDNIKDYCEAHGVILRRQRLNVGDYIIAPKVSIDTKQGMQEIYSDLVSDHDRFRRECLRAQEDGTHLIILIEDDELTSLEDAENWQNPRYLRWERENAFMINAHKAGKFLGQKIPSSPVPSKRLVGMMRAMSERYGVEWLFCRPSETGRVICEILSESG